jgi:hypothetical protein
VVVAVVTVVDVEASAVVEVVIAVDVVASAAVVVAEVSSHVYLCMSAACTWRQMRRLC